jgi:Bacterial Ig-like domain (group 3)
MTIKATSRILLAIAALACTPAWSQAPLTQVVKRIAPSVALTSVPANNVPRVAGSPVEFDMHITGVSAAAPTGSIQFTVTSLGISAPLSGNGPIAAGLASWTATPAPEGFSISASYAGDINYLPVNVTIPAPPAEDFDFSLPDVTVAQGATWKGNMQVVSLNGFAGTIAWTCQNVPPQISCPITGKWPTTTFTAANMNTPQTCPLTIVTSPGDFIPAAGLLLLGFVFSVKSRRRLQLFAGLAFSCVLLFGATGCGSGGKSQWDPLTPKATYQVTVTGTSGIITHSKQLTVVVQ